MTVKLDDVMRRAIEQEWDSYSGVCEECSGCEYREFDTGAPEPVECRAEMEECPALEVVLRGLLLERAEP